MSQPDAPIDLIGTVVLDVTDVPDGGERKARLGGVMHAARALWAIGHPFRIQCVSPPYLHGQVSKYAKSLGAIDCIPIGEIANAPGCMLVRDPAEAGAQGYDYLLRDEMQIEWSDGKELATDVCKKTVLFPHDGRLEDWALHSKCKPGNTIVDVCCIDDSELPLAETFALLSTSTSCRGVFESLFTPACEPQADWSSSLLLKENRGGARLWHSERSYACGALLGAKTVNSIGLGDVFVAALATKDWASDPVACMAFASGIAAAYARTTCPDTFKANVSEFTRQFDEDGYVVNTVSVPWQERKNISVYVAAPDFSYLDTSSIDYLQKCLEYHNFAVVRPVKINGELDESHGTAARRRVGLMDRDLLHQADIVVGVPLIPDPGTFVELGWAWRAGKPIVLWDPRRALVNAMAIAASTEIAEDCEGVITAVFRCASKLLDQRGSAK